MARTRRGRIMAVAKEATISERCDKGNPAKINVSDDAGETTIYAVRYDKPMTRPENGAELVYDDFHPELIGLDTKDGETKLRQAGTGLPDSCVILINLGVAKAFGGVPFKSYPPSSVGMRVFGESDYEYYLCQGTAK
jgi:hypothetical protein